MLPLAVYEIACFSTVSQGPWVSWGSSLGFEIRQAAFWTGLSAIDELCVISFKSLSPLEPQCYHL